MNSYYTIRVCNNGYYFEGYDRDGGETRVLIFKTLEELLSYIKEFLSK